MIARRMLARALDAGVKAAWVVGDSVYGASELRRELEERRQPHLFAVTSAFLVRYWDGQGLVQEPIRKVFMRLGNVALERAGRAVDGGAGARSGRGPGPPAARPPLA